MSFFDSLSEFDKNEVVVEVMRRAPDSFVSDLSDETLVAVAEGHFVAMDSEEAAKQDRQ